jgi:hypothetical protein
MLFKDTNKLQEYAALVNINFINIKSAIRSAEEDYVIDAIGKELYTKLNNDYTTAPAESDLSQAEQDLLHYCRSVIGPYVCYNYAPKADVQVSDAGMQRMETTSNKTAFQYQGKNYREQMLQEGEVATEKLLKFLDDNKTAFPEWTAAAAFTQYRKLFIKSGKEFNDLFRSASPYRNFIAMLPKMYDVEENGMRAFLGDTLFDRMKAKDKATTFTDLEKVLLSKMKKAIAYITVAQAMPFLNVRIDAAGITVSKSARTTNDEISSRNSADDNALSLIIRSCTDAGQSWMNNIKKYLDANAADFTGWTLPVTEPIADTFSNLDARGTFGMI